MTLTPLRPLDAKEQEQLRALLIEAATPAQHAQLLRELIVHRAVNRVTRNAMRCLPSNVRAALAGLPHRPKGTSVEYDHA